MNFLVNGQSGLYIHRRKVKDEERGGGREKTKAPKSKISAHVFSRICITIITLIVAIRADRINSFSLVCNDNFLYQRYC